MAKLEINIAVNRVLSSFFHDIQGRTSVKKCICIPVDALSVDKNGNVWLNMVATDDTKYERQTHSLKQKISRDQYNALPEDENGRKALLPFCGQVKTAEARNGAGAGQTATLQSSVNNVDDLPY